MPDLETLQYPVGRFERLTGRLDPSVRSAHILTIESAPGIFRALVVDVPDHELERTYRPNGWTVRQVVHHVADSHMNAYVRMKLAVTEDSPPVKGYDEKRWAELPEAKRAPVSLSLDLLEALHRRWVTFLRGLQDDVFGRSYLHSDLGRVTLDEALALYSWHGRHHIEHVRLGLGKTASRA
jgi:hypothetical protein